MKRGEIWTVAGGGDYTSKPRPAVILQDDSFDDTDSITVCTITSDHTSAPLFRIPIEPTESNGLATSSRIMVDKIATVRRGRLRERIGLLADDDIVRLNRTIAVFLGIATPRSERSEGPPQHQ